MSGKCTKFDLWGLYDNFKLFVKTVIQKLTCQIWCLIKAKLLNILLLKAGTQKKSSKLNKLPSKKTFNILILKKITNTHTLLRNN